MNKMLKIAAAGCLAAVCGCMTGPVAFKASSAPVPPQGYTVVGSDVTGSSDQVWVFGLGGSMGIQQHKAYKAALASANGADAWRRLMRQALNFSRLIQSPSAGFGMKYISSPSTVL